VSEAPVEAGVDEVQPVPRRTGRPNFDAIVAVTAIFISAVSLYLAIEHGKTERDLVAANVWPFPRAILSNGYDDKGSTAVGVSNGGGGPAKIRSFELFYRGQPVSSGLDLLRKCCGLTPGAVAVKAAFPNGTSNCGRSVGGKGYYGPECECGLPKPTGKVRPGDPWGPPPV
jgi:hypothetical protein